MAASTADTPAVTTAKMCCLAHVASDCAREKLGKMQCPGGVNLVAHFEETLNSFTSETMDLACGEYKTMSACEAKIPDSVASMKETVKNANSVVGNRSFIKPIKELAKRMT